jgi:hypothetical protein
MTREDIEKAAVEFANDKCQKRGCSKTYRLHFDFDRYDIERSFEAGADWRINSVWHDVNEIPEDGRIIVLLGKYGTMIIYGPNMRYYKEAIIMDGGFIKWAYKEDLMPTNVEE